MVDKLYEHTAYPDAPFGPYEKARHVVRSGGNAVDVTNATQDWTQILTLDTSPFKHGHLVIEGDIAAVPGEGFGSLPSSLAWLEIRVVVKYGNTEVIWFEGGLITIYSANSRNSAIVLPFKEHDVPDSLSVWSWTHPQGAGQLDHANVTATTRFVS